MAASAVKTDNYPSLPYLPYLPSLHGRRLYARAYCYVTPPPPAKTVPTV
uniref:Uncharacterized protein n=1 Tax=uncultured bacterium contig00048 TaxID=1181533 RepID=A0A806K2N2_9BACT|nr:hypothetical protein [uncultured bacterium contig00048]